MKKSLKKIRLDFWIIFALLLLGGFFRFYKITELPCGLFPDQALNGLDAIRIANGFISPIFRGNEGLFMYLVAMSHALFGMGIWQIFIVSAFIGTITISATYLAVKEAFNRRIAMITGILLAVSGWHIALSRSGFRATLVPLFIALVSYFLIKSANSQNEKGKMLYYPLTAASLALGFYSYNAYPFFVLGLLLLTGLIIFKNRTKFLSNIRKNEKPLAVALTAFAYIFLPLFLVMLFYPWKYLGRASEISIFIHAENLIESVTILLHNFGEIFMGIIKEGDANWRHNIAGKPLMFPLLTPFFLGGVIYAFFKKYSRILLFLFFVMLWPSALSNDGWQPHGLRIIGILPALFVFPAIFFDWLITRTQKINMHIVMYVILTVIISIIVVSSYKNYFISAPQSADYYGFFRCDLPSIAQEIQTHEDWNIIAEDFTMQSLRYLLYPEKIQYQTPKTFLKNFKETRTLPDGTYIMLSSFGFEDFNTDLVNLMEKHYQKKIVKNRFGKTDYYIFFK